MNEVTEAAKGKGAGKKAGGEGGGPKVDGQVGRMLVRAIWAQEWAAANPGKKGEDRKAAWTEARDAVIEKNLKPYRRALNTLARMGVTITISDAKAALAEDQDDSGED